MSEAQAGPVMSEDARVERRTSRRWAKPGSSHDRLIGLMKFGLPALVGIVIAFLALVPLEERKEASFLLDKNKIERAQERLKVQAAQYRGEDEEGRPFLLDARQAVQATSADPTVEIADMTAQLQLDEGPARLTAGRARFNMDENKVAVVGAIQFAAADGYRIETRDVLVDLHDRTMASEGRVEGSMPLGRFSANRMHVDLPNRHVVLDGRARLHIVQNALRSRR